MPKRQASTKKDQRPVWLRLEHLARPDTGESVLGFVADSRFDAEELRERGYRQGDLVTAELFKDRNPRFYRLAHMMAKFTRDNTEEFAHLTVHATLKLLQLRADVECETTEVVMDLGGFGEHVAVARVPRSLNFKDMDDGAFRPVFEGIRDYVARTHYPEWTDLEIDEMEDLLRGNQPA
jgi:hypothetical protein